MTSQAEEPCQLLPDDAYSHKKAALDSGRRKAIESAEGEIAIDPDHNHWRRRTDRGTTLDFYAADAGLIVGYRRKSKTQVRLIDLIDLA